jgi:hypothetical protein
MIYKIAHNVILIGAAILGSVSFAGCGDNQDCVPVITVTSVDPSGRWAGTLVKKESDCASSSRGESFNFRHDVSLICDRDNESSVVLVNEDQLSFESTQLNLLAGGPFSVKSEQENQTIDISYDNYDGNLADVTQKIRNYSNGKIVCSELYTGQASR